MVSVGRSAKLEYAGSDSKFIATFNQKDFAGLSWKIPQSRQLAKGQ